MIKKMTSGLNLIQALNIDGTLKLELVVALVTSSLVSISAIRIRPQKMLLITATSYN